jgi:hypothetical protein
MLNMVVRKVIVRLLKVSTEIRYILSPLSTVQIGDALLNTGRKHGDLRNLFFLLRKVITQETVHFVHRVFYMYEPI